MKYTIPHYFEQFRCTAAECVDTCCAGWAIMIDEKSLEKYKNTEGALGKPPSQFNRLGGRKFPTV